jgi:enoyl-CoA hydratase/carnithine racemase
VVHGKLVGGGFAIMMNTDYVVTDHEATFCHGNLVRGVCPLGMYSQTLSASAGLSRALRIYLSNVTLDAEAALRHRVVNEICTSGVAAAQSRGHEVGCLLAAQPDLAETLLAARTPLDMGRIAAEAVGHARCLAANGGGFSRIALPDCHAGCARTLSPTSLEMKPVSAPNYERRAVHYVKVPTILTFEAMSGEALRCASPFELMTYGFLFATACLLLFKSRMAGGQTTRC